MSITFSYPPQTQRVAALEFRARLAGEEASWHWSSGQAPVPCSPNRVQGARPSLADVVYQTQVPMLPPRTRRSPRSASNKDRETVPTSRKVTGPRPVTACQLSNPGIRVGVTGPRVWVVVMT